MVNKDEVPPEQQQWSPLVDQEDPDSPNIKKEQEEPWTTQDGQQLQGLEEADVKFTSDPVAVKSEEDEEKLKSSKLHPSERKENRADFGGPEPARNSGPDVLLQPGPEDKAEDSSETERAAVTPQINGLCTYFIMERIRRREEENKVSIMCWSDTLIQTRNVRPTESSISLIASAAGGGGGGGTLPNTRSRTRSGNYQPASLEWPPSTTQASQIH
ncbi:unnamed protein product [Pleuronectes platessa]|uniref:Uncharacterized protein n=1 Tax=Pleuronectes platessa TaxID=8262 RepID=A0A9N7YPJ8_PLEPL|nr:unnamed protein product [Pleuronectes platessa]